MPFMRRLRPIVVANAGHREEFRVAGRETH